MMMIVYIYAYTLLYMFVFMVGDGGLHFLVQASFNFVLDTNVKFAVIVATDRSTRIIKH